MKLKSLLLATAAIATLATSCKKDDNKNSTSNNAAPSASTLAAGTGYIAFNTSKAFNGSTSHKYQKTGLYDQAPAYLSSGTASIQGAHTEVSGTTVGKISTAVLMVYAAKTGTISFGSSSSGVAATFAIAVTNGTSGTATEAYAMESGSLEVTKFSSTEMEGKFSGKAVNDDANAEIDITNGSFAAKF